jgi:hypothetical protein
VEAPWPAFASSSPIKKTFAPVDPEQAILAPLGCTVVFRPCATEDEVLACDADTIICNAAPVTAHVLTHAPCKFGNRSLGSIE